MEATIEVTGLRKRFGSQQALDIGGRPYSTLRTPLTHVGAMLDAGAVQPSRSARNHLLWLAHSQGLTVRRVDEVIEQAGTLFLRFRDA
jgi:hypothetical protein